MPKRGRKELLDPPVEKSINLPSSLVAEVELRMFDPSTNKVVYGGWSKLTERLFREWLAKGAPL